MANLADPVELLSALLTPTVAILTIFLAYKQYRIERLMAKQALYERRLEVYDSALRLCREMGFRGEIENETLMRFYRSFSEAQFILGKDAVNALTVIRDAEIRIRVLEDSIKRTAPDESASLTYELNDKKIWFNQEPKHLFKIFQPYLCLVKDVNLK